MMNVNYNDYSIPSRVKKKKNKMNKWILFASIALLFGIGLIAIYVHGNTPSQESQTLRSKKGQDQQISPPNQASQQDNQIVKDKNESSSQVDTNFSSAPDNNKNEVNQDMKSPWKPIGTVQTEPHTTNFTKNSQDWKEMVNAVQDATGIPAEKLIIWRFENGGAPDLVTGTVSTYENKNTPYQIKLQWVTNEGWMTVDLVQLNENPYLNQ